MRTGTRRTGCRWSCGAERSRDCEDQIKAAMESEMLTKSAMAARMQTSRRALDRLLDPANTGLTLHTLQRAAVAVGRQIRIELI